MALPLSLVQPFRQNQLFVGSGWRGFFAPFNRALATSQSSTSVGPTIYDLEVLARFTENAPPPGWSDLGWIDKFSFNPDSKIGSVKSGYRMATRARYRGDVGEKCSFTFRESSRMATSIATGAQVFNLLRSTAAASLLGPLSSSGVAAIACGASGYVASGAVAGYLGQPVLYVPSGSGAAFPAGTFIVCDQDYANQSGFVGDSGANVFPGAVTDVDFIRKTSDYAATVAAVVPGVGSPAQDALILTKPFLGGGNSTTPGATVYTVPELNPASRGAKVQVVTGFSGRNGGTYLREWSGIFVKATEDGSQMVVYYPRLSPDAYPGVEEFTIDGITSMQEQGQKASMEALAFDDPLDGETVVSYMAYFPATGELSDFQV